MAYEYRTFPICSIGSHVPKLLAAAVSDRINILRADGWYVVSVWAIGDFVYATARREDDQRVQPTE